MADWDTQYVNQPSYTDNLSANSHRRRSSEDSRTSSNKENTKTNNASYAPTRQESLVSESTLDNSSERELILRDGRDLYGESRTESAYENMAMFEKSAPEIPDRQPNKPPFTQSTAPVGSAKAKVAKSPYSPASIDHIPEVAIAIPNDANLQPFNPDQIANFLKCLKIEDRIIAHLHRKNVDGKRFAKLSDYELEQLGLLNNPVVIWFRDRSTVKAKKVKGPFIL